MTRKVSSSLRLRTQADLKALLAGDAKRMRMLKLVRGLSLPDAWIGAGFVRNLVWDALHGFEAATPLQDVDVLYFDRLWLSPEWDLEHEETLSAECPEVKWQVRNQARMHVENDDRPYSSTKAAVSRWPETATSIAARLGKKDEIEILAPHGIRDLLQLKVRPTPHFAKSPEKRELFEKRIRKMKWLKTWPLLQIKDWSKIPVRGK